MPSAFSFSGFSTSPFSQLILPSAVISPNLLPPKSLISKPPVSTLNVMVTWLLLINSCSFESAVSNTEISPSALTCNCTLPALFISSTAFFLRSRLQTHHRLRQFQYVYPQAIIPNCAPMRQLALCLVPNRHLNLIGLSLNHLHHPTLQLVEYRKKTVFFINAAFVTISSDVSPISLPCLTKSFTTASNALLLIAPCRS